MKCYKLTDKYGCTRRKTQWGPGVSHTAKGEGEKLCSDGWIHFYTNPLIAVLMNPCHANFGSPKFWEAESSGVELHEPLKSGCETLTTIEEIPLPEISTTQRIAFGILCVKEVCKLEAWNRWADKWLSGEDRTKKSAYTAYASAANAAAKAIDTASDAANAAAAYASDAADAAATADNDATDYTAYTAARAANATTRYDGYNIDFIALAEKAMTYK